MKKNLLASILSLVCVVGLQANESDCELYNIAINRFAGKSLNTKIYVVKSINMMSIADFRNLFEDLGDTLNFESIYSISHDTIFNCMNQTNRFVINSNDIDSALHKLYDKNFYGYPGYMHGSVISVSNIGYLSGKYASIILKCFVPRETFVIWFKKNNTQIWEIYKTHMSF